MRIARVFFDVHMGQNFKGLLSLCHKAQIRPEAMGESFIVFLNKKKTKFKLLVGHNYLVYHDNKNNQVPLDAIRYLPSAFSGNEFSFDKAIKESLVKKLNK